MIRRSIVAALALSWLACAPSAQPVRSPVVATQAQHPQNAASPAQQAPASPLPNAKNSVKFLVIGDTGTGGRAQYEVATRTVEAHTRFPFDFAIMLGDNLYGGENPSDFVDKFEKPYKPLLDAGVKFYATLGNHDEPAQRFYKPFNMEGKRYYTFKKGDVEFFVLDSTYMTPAQIDWLKGELEKSSAKWKISYMHHPFYSSGERHGSEVDLRTLVEPLFMQYGLNVVFAGHEHFYERLKPQKGIYYITEGGSAKLRRGNIRENSPITANGFDTDNSFMLVEIAGDQMFFETISRRGQLVDSGVYPRQNGKAATNSSTK